MKLFSKKDTKKKDTDDIKNTEKTNENDENVNQTEMDFDDDDMDEESAGGDDNIAPDKSDDNVIEVRRAMGKKGKLIMAVALAVIVVGLATALMRYNSIKTYTQYKVISSAETSGDNIADYLVFAGNVLKVTKDGAAYIDEKGVVKWDVSYAMKMPHAEVCGDYAVVADMNGKDVYVFNVDGEVSRQTLAYDISNVDIAKQGVYSLVLVGEDGNYINGYDKDSSVIYELKTSIEKSGYPMDIDLSDDGQKLVTSYMKVQGTQVQSVIAMYNFGSVGQNENADRMMGSYTIDNAIYPIVKFTDNDNIACFGNKDIRLYSMKEKPDEKSVIDLESREMQGIFYNSSYVGYIALSGQDNGAKYKMYVYDDSGKLRSEMDYADSFDKIYATEDEIIVVGDMDCSIFRLNGSVKFQYSFKKNLVNVVPDSNKEEYVVIFENETQTIQLKGM